MGMIELKVELLSQLGVDGLDNLADSVGGALEGVRELLKLVALRQREQGPPPPIKATWRGNVRKQGPLFFPLTEHRRFLVPFSTFPYQSHRQQFAVAAQPCWSRLLKQWLNLLPNIIDHHLHPQAKIV